MSRWKEKSRGPFHKAAALIRLQCSRIYISFTPSTNAFNLRLREG